MSEYKIEFLTTAGYVLKRRDQNGHYQFLNKNQAETACRLLNTPLPLSADNEAERPEECELVAVSTGDGWGLCVEKNGNTIAYLKWPEAFGEWKTADQLRQAGFRIE